MQQQLHLRRTPHTRLRGRVNFEPEQSIPITCSLKFFSYLWLIVTCTKSPPPSNHRSERLGGSLWGQVSFLTENQFVAKYPFTNYAVRLPTVKESVFKELDLTSTIHVKITRHSLALLTPLSSERQITLRWYWLPLRWPKHQALLPTTVLLRTTLTWTIRL